MATVNDWMHDAIARVRALHRPAYKINGVEHEHRVYVNEQDMEGVADHVCSISPDACEPGDFHYVLACIECRQVTEDGEAGYPLWPCLTIRALDDVQ